MNNNLKKLKMIKKLFLFLITTTITSLLIHPKQKNQKLIDTFSKKSLKTNENAKPRNLDLFPTGANDLKVYGQKMELQSKYLKQVMDLIDKENKEAKMDEMSNDDLQFFEERKEGVLKKIGSVKNQLQTRLGEFYTKYIQMPMMGNYSYWDLTNPASLH